MQNKLTADIIFTTQECFILTVHVKGDDFIHM